MPLAIANVWDAAPFLQWMHLHSCSSWADSHERSHWLFSVTIPTVQPVKNQTVLCARFITQQEARVLGCIVVYYTAARSWLLLLSDAVQCHVPAGSHRTVQPTALTFKFSLPSIARLDALIHSTNQVFLLSSNHFEPANTSIFKLSSTSRSTINNAVN